MSISFLQIPLGGKVPGAFVEFDTSRAQQGTSIKPYNALVIGQRLTAGTKAEKQIDKVTSEAQAENYYGRGSMLYHMIKAFIKENQNLNELNAISLNDDGGSTKSAGSLEILTPPTADGSLAVMIGGRNYTIAVVDADTEEDIVDNLVAEINADDYRHVDVAKDGVNADLMNIVARHGGVVGDDLDIRVNYFDGEVLPAGVTVSITAMGAVTAGATNPAITDVITAMGEKQYDIIVMPYSDAANLLLMKTELDDRWGPIRQNDGHLIFCRKEAFAAHSTFLDGRNSEQESVLDIAGPTPQFEWAANLGAVIAANAQIDPARPFQTLPLTQVLAPADSELFDYGERDQILKAGGSSYNVDAAGTVRVERIRTTRIENELAAPDEALADLNSKLTLSYIRYDFRVLMLTKYPRHKLADDGTRFGPGQAVITPLIGRAEAVARFELWAEQGLVEGLDQFKRDLIVERSSSDVNRLDFLLPPDLINQLRVVGAQIGFLL